MKQCYNSLRRDEKVDILIPERAEWLQPIALTKYSSVEYTISWAFKYNWPKKNWEGDQERIELKRGEVYDRIGSKHGKYVSPIINNKPFSFLERALPYYIPEENISDSPAYHRYSIINPYGSATSDEAVKSVVAKAFHENPRDGGGLQVEFKMHLDEIKGVFLDE